MAVGKNLKWLIKPKRGGILKIRNIRQSGNQVQPTFGECTPPIGFTIVNFKAKVMMNLYICKS
jgi:hypothetical protein